jgi:hypothetical protein
MAVDDSDPQIIRMFKISGNISKKSTIPHHLLASGREIPF